MKLMINMNIFTIQLNLNCICDITYCMFLFRLLLGEPNQSEEKVHLSNLSLKSESMASFIEVMKSFNLYSLYGSPPII